MKRGLIFMAIGAVLAGAMQVGKGKVTFHNTAGARTVSKGTFTVSPSGIQIRPARN